MTINEYLNDRAIDLQIELENYLTQNGKVATGKTLDSIDITVSGETINISLSEVFLFIDKGVNGVLVDQGSPYSFSGNSKMIPPDSLLPWMKAKGIPESAKFPIAKAIYRDGIKGIGGSVINIDRLIDNFMNSVGDGLEDKLAEEIEVNFGFK